jgi:hypothetical protein
MKRYYKTPIIYYTTRIQVSKQAHINFYNCKLKDREFVVIVVNTDSLQM